ncbi:uncharacterized protein PGTG_02344 [Puccinia graminis f. sp. tritici CRL 75-36-700-3]|uniref:Uncharacterized protein n=1 Tax=Puccinia graminis f. sp. tritici (strain CRL 75-36-700-3 / race SCCL) TaxID=418459 RepID=E3JXV8_PUCGT|nr:uncharacterized protein PGTG_02344 [Puccinia graminis f. sp. tritici CRL 75-36-700-3]EFP76883.2 hypothetical protein PGTG_02344 [Puccinia graminis f. sp. tritici CRL 75-36-700-3]
MYFPILGQIPHYTGKAEVTSHIPFRTQQKVLTNTFELNNGATHGLAVHNHRADNPLGQGTLTTRPPHLATAGPVHAGSRSGAGEVSPLVSYHQTSPHDYPAGSVTCVIPSAPLHQVLPVNDQRPPIPIQPPADIPIPSPGGSSVPSTILANGGVRTRKPTRTAEEMRLADLIAAEKHARRFQNQADKAADARQKQATIAANKILKAQKAALTNPWVTWTEEQMIELLNFVRMVKEDHSQVTGGFIPFGKYFAAYTGRPEAFPLLQSFLTATRLSKYHALMDKWKKVKDVVDRSGAGGLSSALEAGGVSQEVWDLILDMHGDNPAATGEGLSSSYADYETLLEESPPSVSSGDSGSSDVNEPNSLPTTPAPRKKRLTKYQRLSAALTPAELALDPDSGSDTDLPAELVLAPPGSSTGSAALQGTVPTAVVGGSVANIPGSPATTPSVPRKGTKIKVKSAAAKQLISRPPAKGSSIPQQRGRTEEKIPDGASGTGMLVMMQKAQEATASWAAEERRDALVERARQDALCGEERADRQRLEDARADERAAELKRQDQLRADDRRAAEKRADAMEVARRQEMQEAKEDRELLRQQAKLDREVADHQMKMEREAAQARAAEAAEDRKRERQRDLEQKAEDKKEAQEHEDRAERQQQSRQLFELAMLKALGFAVANPDDAPPAGGAGSSRKMKRAKIVVVIVS